MKIQTKNKERLSKLGSKPINTSEHILSLIIKKYINILLLLLLLSYEVFKMQVITYL